MTAQPVTTALAAQQLPRISNALLVTTAKLTLRRCTLVKSEHTTLMLVKNPLPIAWLVPPAQLVLPELKLQTISPASLVSLDTTVRMTHQRSNALWDTTALLTRISPPLAQKDTTLITWLNLPALSAPPVSIAVMTFSMNFQALP